METSTAKRLAIGATFATAILLMWVIGAVGLIGAEGNPADRMYAGVIAIAGVGALITRLRPAGMASNSRDTWARTDGAVTGRGQARPDGRAGGDYKGGRIRSRSARSRTHAIPSTCLKWRSADTRSAPVSMA